MPTCCRCNGSGRCVNCTCVKSGLACSNCLPLRKGNCANLADRTTLRQTAGPDQLPIPPLLHPALAASQTTSCTDEATIHGIPVSDNHIPLQESMTSSRNSFVASSLAGDAEHLPSSVTPGGTGALPPCAPLSSTPFHWGEVPGHVFCEDIASVYEEQVLWRKNIFSPPHRTCRNRVCQGTYTAPTCLQGQDTT